MGRRRFYRKRWTPLKRVYSNTSAKSQAKQIAYLNKKVNRLTAANRPEIKQWISTYTNKQFSSSSLSTTFKTIYLKGPNKGEDQGERVGDKIKVKNVNAHFYFEYFNTATTGFHNSESSGACIRIIALQRKNTERAYDTTVDANSIIFNYSGSGTGYTMGANSPLVPDVTSMFRVLYDKTRTITLQRNQMVWDINLKKIGTWVYKSDSYVNNIVFLVVVTGLHADTDFTEYVNENDGIKIAYTDA